MSIGYPRGSKNPGPPMKNATEILDTYEQVGWKNNDPMAQTLQLRRDAPGALGELVLQAVGRQLESSTFIDAALDLMDDSDYIATVAHVWRQPRQDADSDIAGAILDSAALQHPDVFAPDWERLLMSAHAGHGGPSYQEDHAWRAIDRATLDDWLAGLKQDLSEGSLGRKRAIALLRSRRPDAALHALQHLFPDPSDAEAASWLQQAGYAMRAGALHALHSERPLHIGFSAEQRKRMLAEQPAWRRDIHKSHPTWISPEKPTTHARMGGSLSALCGLCHAPLHRLLALADPDAAGVASGAALEFATCLSCQGWEADGALFYRHDAEGLPTPHPAQQRDAPLTPDHVASPLLEAQVDLFEAPARWRWQDWGESNGRQNLSRVGGAPSWVQSADYPECPDCGQHMDLAMQLDSGLPQADGGEWLWGSGGCNYTFWCKHCRVSGQLWQCT